MVGHPLAGALLPPLISMPTSFSDPEAATELFELPDEEEPSDDEVQEVPTQPIALFELPPSKP